VIEFAVPYIPLVLTWMEQKEVEKHLISLRIEYRNYESKLKDLQGKDNAEPLGGTKRKRPDDLRNDQANKRLRSAVSVSGSETASVSTSTATSNSTATSTSTSTSTPISAPWVLPKNVTCGTSQEKTRNGRADCLTPCW